MTTPLQAAKRISIVTLGSRILGLIRDVMMFGMFDFPWAFGTFVLAWMIPNLLRRLFGEGALSASFIPAYARARETGGEPAAERLLGAVLGMLLVVLVSITGLVWVATLFLPGEVIGTAGAEVDAATQGALLLDLTAILFPYAIPICLAAVLTGALNAHGTFALPAAAPIILNLFWIGGLVYAGQTGMTDPAEVVTLLAKLLMVGGFAQLSLSLVPMIRRGLIGKLRLPGPGDPARDVVRAMAPTLIGMSLVQMNSVLDQLLASYLVDASAPAFIFQANRLLLFPHALTSLALATAIFPRLATLGVRGDLVGVRTNTDRAMLHTLMVSLPAAVGMMLVAAPLLQVMFRGSAITDGNLAISTQTTICLVASLPAIGVAQLHARALYALGDYRTPAWMSFWLLVLNAILDVVFVVGFGWGVPAFAIATSIASLCNAAVLRLKLRRLCPESQAAGASLWVTLLATGTMAGVVAAAHYGFQSTSRWEIVAYDLAIPVAAGMLSYAGVQWLFGQRQLRLR